jgi:hypothetical protein
LDSVQVTPATQSLSAGQTAQLTATGTFGNAKHPSTQNITTAVTWSSTSPSVATVNATGLVTAVAAGSTTIVANATAFNGPVSSSSQLTVTSAGGGPAGGGGGGGSGGTGGSGGNILSLTIIPSGIVFGTLGDSGQFLAIGTFSTAPTVRDVTNSVTWLTSGPNVFPITNYGNGAPGGGTENGGVVSAYGNSVGNVGATITAEATDSNGSIATATASVGCPLVLPDPTAHPPVPGSCFNFVPPLLATLTVYNEGLDTTNWLVTAPSATNTPDVIHCGPGWVADGNAGGSVCTATYPLGTTVTLTAPPQKGVKFGGWSSTCRPTVTVNPDGPNECTVTVGGQNVDPNGNPFYLTDVTVGAIFNDETP